MAGVMGRPLGYKKAVTGLSDADTLVESGYYRYWDDTTGVNQIEVKNLDTFIFQLHGNRGVIETRTSHNNGSSWSEWTRCDNFGYNTLGELAAALKPLM